MSNLLVQNIKHTNNTTAMTVNSNGLISPRIPILQVNATDTDQAYTQSSGFVKVEWETVEIDTLNGWSTSNNNYTPSVAGYYLVGGALRLGMSDTEHSFFQITIRKNNSQLLRTQFNYTSDVLKNGIYPAPTGLIEVNGSSDVLDMAISSDEDMEVHQNTDKSYFFAQLVHAT